MKNLIIYILLCCLWQNTFAQIVIDETKVKSWSEYSKERLAEFRVEQSEMYKKDKIDAQKLIYFIDNQLLDDEKKLRTYKIEVEKYHELSSATASMAYKHSLESGVNFIESVVSYVDKIGVSNTSIAEIPTVLLPINSEALIEVSTKLYMKMISDATNELSDYKNDIAKSNKSVGQQLYKYLEDPENNKIEIDYKSSYLYTTNLMKEMKLFFKSGIDTDMKKDMENNETLKMLNVAEDDLGKKVFDKLVEYGTQTGGIVSKHNNGKGGKAIQLVSAIPSSVDMIGNFAKAFEYSNMNNEYREKEAYYGSMEYHKEQEIKLLQDIKENLDIENPELLRIQMSLLLEEKPSESIKTYFSYDSYEHNDVLNKLRKESNNDNVIIETVDINKSSQNNIEGGHILQGYISKNVVIDNTIRIGHYKQILYKNDILRLIINGVDLPRINSDFWINEFQNKVGEFKFQNPMPKIRSMDHEIENTIHKNMRGYQDE